MSDVDPLLMLTGVAYRSAATRTDPAAIHHHAWSMVPRDCDDPEAWVAGFKAAVEAIRPLLLDVAMSADETMERLQRLARPEPVLKRHTDSDLNQAIKAWTEVIGSRRHLLVLDDSPAVQVTPTPHALPKFTRSQPALARILGMPATARCW